MSKSVPKRRFKGFEDNWEQRELKYVAEYIRGSFPQPYTNKDFYDEMNGKPFVQVADIGFDLRLNQDTKQHISKLAEPKSRFVEAGKVVVALQGSIETSIGRTAITQYDAYFDRTILIFEKYKVPIDKIYFAQVIKELFAKEKEKAWGATISTITKDYLNDFVICVPNVEEQQKIGEFLQFLDNLSNLYQQKYDKLQALKKAYLYEMFPQEGESVPKRRFAGFSGEWEKSYIENIASFSKGIGYTKNDLQPEGTPIILYGRLYTDYEFEIKNVNSFADKNDFAMISKGNEVIVPASGETAEDIARASAVNVAGCILGGDLNIITPNSEIDSAFLALAMSNGYSSKDLARRAQGKTVVHVHNSDIKEVMVSYPSINEQQKIVNYVRNLDNNIKVINAKLQKLKALKQSYLAEMFV